MFKISSWFTNKIVRCCPMLFRRQKSGFLGLSPAFQPFIKSFLSTFWSSGRRLHSLASCSEAKSRKEANHTCAYMHGPILNGS